MLHRKCWRQFRCAGNGALHLMSAGTCRKMQQHLSDKENSSHRRAILWRTFWEVSGGVLGGIFRSCPLTSQKLPSVEITRPWSNFLEVCFRTPGPSQKLLQKSALRCIWLLSVLNLGRWGAYYHEQVHMIEPRVFKLPCYAYVGHWGDLGTPVGALPTGAAVRLNKFHRTQFVCPNDMTDRN